MAVYRQVLYAGRVQGVGFRYTVKQIASGYEVVGWIRNLPDGRVELQTAGDAGEIEAFLRAIAQSQLGDYIKKDDAVDLPPPEAAWIGFEIRH